LNGRRGITGDTALRLPDFFGTSAEFWLNLQGLYDVRLTQQKVGDTLNCLPTLKMRNACTLDAGKMEPVSSAASSANNTACSAYAGRMSSERIWIASAH
jgi:hypothetical protein